MQERVCENIIVMFAAAFSTEFADFLYPQYFSVFLRVLRGNSSADI